MQDMVPMRHRRCGGVALLLAGHVIDNPSATFMARDIQKPDGTPVKAGVPLTCAHCGELIGPLGPSTLAVDRGPDRRQSKLQALSLWVTTRILGWPTQSTRGV